MGKGVSRRRFLKASLGLALGALAYGWAESQGRALPPSPPRRVLLEDLRLGPTDLAQGTLNGLTLRDGHLTSADEGAPGHYLSPVLRADFPFTHLGLHWLAAADDPKAISFSLRTSGDGLAWGPWQPVLLEPHVPEGAGESYGALLSGQGGRYAQFWASFGQRGGPPRLKKVTLTFINVVDGPLATGFDTGVAAAFAASAKPVTFSREDWGADESLRFHSRDEIWPRVYVPTKKVAVHHTATGNDYASVEEAKALVRAIYAYHARTLGWGDIGYNVLIDKFGNSYEGRRGRDGPGYDGPAGREILSEDVVAGHASHHNYGSVGIALLGTFCTASECAGAASPTSAMVQRLQELLLWECSQHKLDPGAASHFLRSDGQWTPGLANIFGHRDVGPTICPGGNAYALLPSLRDYLGPQLVNASAPVVTLIDYPPEATVSSPRLRYRWQGTGTGDLLYSYYLEGWHKPSASSVITYVSGFTEQQSPAWSSWRPDTEASFQNDGLGPFTHFTFHVKAKDGSARESVYEEQRTVFMPGPLPGAHRSVVPGVIKG